MRRILSAMAAAAAVALLSTALAGSSLAGSSIRVSATVPLTWSGVVVTRGATYDVTATGYAQTAKNAYYHVPGVSTTGSGPAGQPKPGCLAEYQNDVNGRCTAVNAGFGELVGVIVDDNGMTLATVEIGARPTFVAPATGGLFLAVNDLNLTYWDNNGQFDVVITPR